jgi:hypothetical protein
MATLTIKLEPELLQAAQQQAEQRNITVEQFIADTIATVLPSTGHPYDNSTLVRLMDEGILGDLGPLPTRDEIYAERTQWPRS